MPLVYSYNSNKGRKNKNEDAISVFKNSQGATFGIVCDGIGSHSNSAYSSNFIVSTFEKEWKSLTFANFNNMKNWVADRIERLNTEIFEKSLNSDKKMGTTLVAVAIFDNQVAVFNIGDSRAYGVVGEDINVMTVEDSFVGALINAGAITVDEAKTHPERHVLTQAVGTKESVDLHVTEVFLESYRYFILCSDGLTNMIEEKEILEIINNNELSVAVETLISLSVDRGGVDNISVAIIKNLRGENND